jgi:hypothetical protein
MTLDTFDLRAVLGEHVATLTHRIEPPFPPHRRVSRPTRTA